MIQSEVLSAGEFCGLEGGSVTPVDVVGDVVMVLVTGAEGVGVVGVGGSVGWSADERGCRRAVSDGDGRVCDIGV